MAVLMPDARSILRALKEGTTNETRVESEHVMRAPGPLCRRSRARSDRGLLLRTTNTNLPGRVSELSEVNVQYRGAR